MMPRATIIILNWNGQVDTLACLTSLASLDYPNYEIVVVDNGSSDNSVPTIKSQFSSVTVIENKNNLGFAGGNNVGIQYALTHHTDYILLLNNDTEVAPDFLSHIINAAEANPGVGVAGPTIYYHTHPNLIWSAGGNIDWRRGKSSMQGLNTKDTGQFGTQPRIVDFVTGCALLAKSSIFEQVGNLDERFFMYYEETEWCARVARAGFKIIHVPLSKIWHKIPIDARDSSPRVHYYMTRNRLLFLKLTNANLLVWGRVLLGEYLRTLLSWSLKSKWQGKRKHRDLMLQAIKDAWRGRWGYAVLDRSNKYAHTQET